MSKNRNVKNASAWPAIRYPMKNVATCQWVKRIKDEKVNEAYVSERKQVSYDEQLQNN